MVPSVRTFVVAVPSQESAVRPVMVVFVQGSRLESIDVAAVEVSLFSACRCGTVLWPQVNLCVSISRTPAASNQT